MVGELRSKCFLFRVFGLLMLMLGVGLGPLSEANKDKAAHLEMIRSMRG